VILGSNVLEHGDSSYFLRFAVPLETLSMQIELVTPSEVVYIFVFGTQPDISRRDHKNEY